MNKNTQTNPPGKTWISGDELTLAAEYIVGELDDEAMEALPSDLKPNTDDLNLTEEDETALLAILNSVTSSGILGALGASSPMQALLKQKARLESNFRRAQRRMVSLKKQISGKIPPKQKAEMEKQIKQIEGGLKRNTAKRKAVEKQINQLKAKAKTDTKKPPAEPSLVSQKNQLQREQGRLRGVKRTLMKKSAELAAMEKEKRISPKDALEQKRKMEQRWKQNEKQLQSIGKSIRMINGKIKAEERRVAAEKKAEGAKALEVKKAADQAKSAEKMLQESKAKAAQKEAEAKKEAERKKKQVLEAKRRAEKAQKTEASGKASDSKASQAEAARMEVSKARVENEARAISQEASQIKQEEAEMKQQVVRAKAANDAERQKIRRRLKGAEEQAKNAPQKVEKRFQAKLRKAESIKDSATRQKAINAARERKKYEENYNLKRFQNQKRLAVEQEKNVDAKDKRQMEEYRKKVEKLQQRKQQLEQRRRVVERQLSHLAEMDAASTAAQKQREIQQRKRAEQARASKTKQLELERKKEQDAARAKAELEKAKKDVAAKKAEAEKRRAEKRKADAERLRQKAERDKKAREQRSMELEKGIEKITGKKSDAIDLSRLDISVLLELKALMQASGGHRLLSAVLSMIKLKSEKEESPRPSREEIFSNMLRITGFSSPAELERGLHNLELPVLEELLEYSESVSMGRNEQLKSIVSMKRFLAELAAHGIKLTVEMIYRGDLESLQKGLQKLDIVGLDALIDSLKSNSALSQDKSGILKALLMKMEFMRAQKMAEMEVKTEAAEEARAKNQQEKLEAIEKAREVKKEEELKEAAAKLEEEKRQLATEVARVEQAVSAEKQRVEADSAAEVQKIDREYEEKKTESEKRISDQLSEREEELKDQARQDMEDIKLEAEVKLVETKQAHAEIEEEMRAEAAERVIEIEAEISNTDDPAVKNALYENLRVEQEARDRELEEAAKSHALEEQKIKEEAKLLEREAEQTLHSSLDEEKRDAEEQLESEVQTIEQQKQDLIEKQEVVTEIEQEMVEIEGDIHTEILEEEKRDAEEDMDMVEGTVVAVEEEPVPPRSSKDGRVTVSRKTNPNGSSFIKMSVPSDLSPGESDEISVFLSKGVVDLLAEYHRVHKKIAGQGSLEDISSEEKAVLASAGAEFKTIRDQYVQQRREKVLERSKLLLATM